MQGLMVVHPGEYTNNSLVMHSTPNGNMHGLMLVQPGEYTNNGLVMHSTSNGNNTCKDLCTCTCTAWGIHEQQLSDAQYSSNLLTPT